MQPGTPNVRISHTGTVRKWPDGRLFIEPLIELPNEQIEEIRQGYRCINCLAAQQEAFPEFCIEKPYGVCSFPIRERQMERFHQMFVGDTTDPMVERESEGEQISVEEFLSGMWMPEGAELEAELEHREHGLWLPPELDGR